MKKETDMNNNISSSVFPTLTDEVAFELYNFLDQLTRTVESKYFTQIHQHLMPEAPDGSWWRPTDDLSYETGDFFDDGIPF
jgi:hypothetical protein